MRMIAANFDIEAAIKDAEAVIAMSQKIHDPENHHLFAEAAQEAFKDVEL